MGTLKIAYDPAEEWNDSSESAISAIATVALGGFAIGALSVGSLAIGGLGIGRARIKSLQIKGLAVKHLRAADASFAERLTLGGTGVSLKLPSGASAEKSKRGVRSSRTPRFSKTSFVAGA